MDVRAFAVLKKLNDYDLVIIGGGLVGGSLACALAGTGLRLCVVEAEPPRRGHVAQGRHPLLPMIQPRKTESTPVGHMDLPDRLRPRRDRLPQADAPEDAATAPGQGNDPLVIARLGLRPRRLGQAIQGGLTGVEMLCPARLLGVRVRRERVALEVTVGNTSRLLETRLLVAADGGDSSVRGRLGLAVREHGYGYDALITTVTPERPRPGVAFERFTETGPLALLPMTEGRYSLVWTVRGGEADGLRNLSDREFLAGLQGRFGYRLGKFTRPGRRLTYPLRLMLTREPVRRRLVLIGNAAHTLHPVAGQGFNLGLRDVAALAEVLAQAARAGDDLGGNRTLDAYRRLRARDQTTVVAATDALARLFVNPWLPVRWARDLGLLGLDLAPGLRHLVARRFMGLGGMNQPRLARGLPLETGQPN